MARKPKIVTPPADVWVVVEDVKWYLGGTRTQRYDLFFEDAEEVLEYIVKDYYKRRDIYTSLDKVTTTVFRLINGSWVRHELQPPTLLPVLDPA